MQNNHTSKIDNTKQGKSSSFKYEWICYARSYISLARIGLEELINPQHRGSLFEDTVYENRELLIPILWNLKHAIEISIKALGIVIDKKYLNTHNSKTLADDLKIKIGDLDIVKKHKLDDFAYLIHKYYKCEFLNKKAVSNIAVLDHKNDLFRYPDNATGCTVDSKNFRYFSKRELCEIFDDAKELNALLGILHSQIIK